MVKAKINLENDIITINRRKTLIRIPISCKRTKERYENPATYMINFLFDKPLKRIKKEEIIFTNELSKQEQHQLNKLLKEQETFKELKKILISAPVLLFLNFYKPFILCTNVSLKGLEAVLE